MPITINDTNPQVISMKLEGVLSEQDIETFLASVRDHLARATGPIAFCVDAMTSDGGMNKHRKLIADFFAARPRPPFGRCAGMAVVAETEGQIGFLRDVVASGPVPFPYRFFTKDFEAATWARARLKEKEGAT